MLSDPWGIAEACSIPRHVANLLDLLDGRHTVPQIAQSLRLRTGLRFAPDEVDAFVEELGAGGWLDDDTFRERWASALEAYLAAPFRLPRGAGLLYPETLEALHDQLVAVMPPRTGRKVPRSSVCGVLFPHVPPDLAGSVVDATLIGMPHAEDLDLIVLLGTAHGPGTLPFAVTVKPYVTPLGPTRERPELLTALLRRVPWLTREELRHRDALSLELGILYLQALYGHELPPLLPILCGWQVLDDQDAPEVQTVLGALEALTEGLRVLWCGTAELSHTGPAYGHAPLDSNMQRRAESSDRACLEALASGSATRVAQRCRDAAPTGRPSGGAVMTALSYLLPTGYRCEIASYERRRPPGPTLGEMGLAGVRFLQDRSQSVRG